MTAHQQLATTAAGLDPATLTREQLQGWACAPACDVRPAPPAPTAWGRFLDHAVDCADCRTGRRCAAGNGLHHAVREAVTATAP